MESEWLANPAPVLLDSAGSGWRYEGIVQCHHKVCGIPVTMDLTPLMQGTAARQSALRVAGLYLVPRRTSRGLEILYYELLHCAVVRNGKAHPTSIQPQKELWDAQNQDQLPVQGLGAQDMR